MASEQVNILEFSNLKLGYRSDHILIDSASGELKEGEMLALLGRNGAGKSTLLRTLCRNQSALKGVIKLQGRDINNYSLREFSKILAYVSSGTGFAEDMNVYEMVALGRHPHTNWWGSLTKIDHEKILESICFVGMHDFQNARVSSLSDGERQRVMIARALAQDTKLIVLDEPTAFLDIPNRVGIAEVLYDLRKAGKSVVFSTHDLDTAFQFADRIWLITGNDLIQGAPEDLGINKVYDEMFDSGDLLFDEWEMRFRRQLKASEYIKLKGDNNLVKLWTVRSLNRVGIGVVGVNALPEMEDEGSEQNRNIGNLKDETPIEVEIRTVDELVWEISVNGKKKSAYSVYELCRILTME